MHEAEALGKGTSNLLTTAEERAWRAVLPARRSVFGSVEYARISESQSGYSARLFIHGTPQSSVAYPFVLRPIGPLGYLDEDAASYDTLSPEYTGPLLVAGSQPDRETFSSAWDACCRELGIVAEFAHLHPWNAQIRCLDERSVELDREIVYVDLTIPVAVLQEEHFSYACRKNLRRAETERVEVYPARESADIAAFHRVYTATMNRNNALGKYYFSLDYFMSFFQTLPDNALFMLAKHRGEVVAGTLYLHDDLDVYSYLGGADQEFQHVRPTNAVIFETIRWAQAHGKQRLILGGGYKPDDGIFRFKASFSPLRARFSVYRKVHSQSAYAALTGEWARRTGGDPATAQYFPVYRAPAPMQ